MAWTIKMEKPAEREFAKLDVGVQRQIDQKLDWLEKHFDEVHHRALHGNWKNFFKIRIGRWRIMYTFRETDQLIRIWHIDNRDSIYKHK